MASPTFSGQNVTHTKTRVANGAVIKYGFVIADTADLTKAKVPGTQGDASIGISMENAADGEEFSIADEGIYPIIDELGALNNGDGVTCATTAKHKGMAAVTGDYQNGKVVGPDGVAAGDHVYIELQRVPTIVA